MLTLQLFVKHKQGPDPASVNANRGSHGVHGVTPCCTQYTVLSMSHVHVNIESRHTQQHTSKDPAIGMVDLP